jgi:hypothetical protein
MKSGAILRQVRAESKFFAMNGTRRGDENFSRPGPVKYLPTGIQRVF